MKTGQYYYTIVCRYYTINGIIELDLYEVFKRLHMRPYFETTYGKSWRIYDVVYHHVNTGQAVEYVIKRVLRNIEINEITKSLYSIHSPYSLMYDCIYDLKEVEKMNYESIYIRMRMSDKEFNKVYGQII